MATARLFESSEATAALIDQAQLENLNQRRRCGATPTRPVPEHCSRIGSRAPTGSGSKVWNPDDPVRNVEVRNETAKAETRREAAKLPRHVHDPCMSANASVRTLVLASAGISGPQPWIRWSSDGTKMQKCARSARRDVCVNDP